MAVEREQEQVDPYPERTANEPNKKFDCYERHVCGIPVVRIWPKKVSIVSYCACHPLVMKLCLAKKRIIRMMRQRAPTEANVITVVHWKMEKLI